MPNLTSTFLLIHPGRLKSCFRASRVFFCLKSFPLFFVFSWLIVFGSTQARAQTISAIAGNGVTTYAGDGGPATLASLWNPDGLAFDSHGNLFIADAGNGVVRKVERYTGIISTYAGNSDATTYSGDGGPATLAGLNYPFGIVFDAQDDLYIADFYDHVIRKVTASTGIITTAIGIVSPYSGGYAGDGGPALNARLNGPKGLAFDAQGHLYISDALNNVVRKVDAVTGIITTVAGNSVPAYSGDGGPATLASLYTPCGLAFDSSGNLFICDTFNYAVRKVDASTGIISTVAGTGAQGYSGDGGPATLASLDLPEGVILDCKDNLYLTDDFNDRVRMVAAATGIITTVAGIGTAGYSGDGGPAVSAELSHPQALLFDGQWNLILADYDFSIIRKITGLADYCLPTPTSTPLPCQDPPDSYAYPNPANGKTLNFYYHLCEAGLVTVSVFNSAAERVASFPDQGSLGDNTLTADISRFAYGVYYYLVEAEGPSGKRKSKPVKFAVVR